MQRLCAAAVLMLLVGGCWGGDPNDASPTTTQPSEVAPATPAEMVIELPDAPQFIEGFNYGVQVTFDGEVVQELLLADFDLVVDGTKDGPQGEASTWRATLDVPVGTTQVRSDLRSYSSEVPDFSMGCTTPTEVASGDATLLRLDWDSGCLKLPVPSP